MAYIVYRITRAQRVTRAFALPLGFVWLRLACFHDFVKTRLACLREIAKTGRACFIEFAKTRRACFGRIRENMSGVGQIIVVMLIIIMVNVMVL